MSAKAANPRRHTRQELAIGLSGSRSVLREFLKRVAAAALLLLLLCGCAKPSNVSTALTFKRKSPDTVLVTLKIRNLENRATTPIIPEVSVQTQTDGKWDRPSTIIQTAAFVLNRREEHDLTATLKTKASLIRATLTIKEAETGVMLKNERVERALPAMPAR